MAEARVGTSGWSYPEWVGRFYPVGTKPARMLPFYARRFGAVEAHSTYRRLPTVSTLERWAADTPGEFRFAPKVHLGITHQRDLEGVDERVAAFIDAVAPLGDRLGPLIFSLPHQAPDLHRLDRLLAALPTAWPGEAPGGEARPGQAPGGEARPGQAPGGEARPGQAPGGEARPGQAPGGEARPGQAPGGEARPGQAPGPVRAAFELGPGWHTPEVLDRLDSRSLTLALIEADGRPAPDIAVGSFNYLRLRKSRYTRADLEAWAEKLARARASGRDSYVFFKHDEQGDGPRYARRLMARLAEAS